MTSSLSSRKRLTVTAASKPKKKVDHRTIVAREKRIAMRARILNATMKVFSEQEGMRPKIDDIIETAGISKGGFYRYFDSANEVLEEIAKNVADEFSQIILPTYDVLDDPVQRACVGTRLVLNRAAQDPEWGGFLIRADLTDHESRLLKFVEEDIVRGVTSGQFHVADAKVASELIMGINHTAIRVMLRTKPKDPDVYIDLAVRFLLQALGVSVSQIEDVLKWSVGYFNSLGTRADTEVGGD